MLKVFTQPYPLQSNIQQKLSIPILAGLCVFCIFFFFQPFGIEIYGNKKIAIIGMQYAFITIVISSFCNVIVPMLLPKLFNEKNWTVFSEILFLLFIITFIATGNFIFTTYIFNVKNSVSLFLNLVLYTFAFGIFPILISVVTKQQRLLKKYATEASNMDAILVNKVELEAKYENIPQSEANITISNEHILPNNSFTIKGNNQKEKIQLYLNEFLYAEAADNYTAIHFIKNDKQGQVLFRTSIKNVDEQHQLPDFLFRCHKSYLVNLQKVNHISGNAQGYSLHLTNSAIKIPVSRSLNTIIKEKINTFLQVSS